MTPFLQQAGVWFSSDRVTMGGIGAGAGVDLDWSCGAVAQADLSVLWGNGNAVPTRLAIGWARGGLWAPAAFGTFGLLWGQRTEVLSESGERPAAPVWVTGARVAPLRFRVPGGFVSALEAGYGVGPDGGRNLELTLLAAGARW